MSTSAPEATTDYSTGPMGSRAPTERPGRTRLALAGLAMVAAVLLVLSTFLTLFEIRTGGATLRTYSGLDHHSVAMLLLGLAVVPMTLGALRGARPAMAALAALGAVVLVVAFTVDLPAALDEGVLAVTYEGASASPGIGFYLETSAGALLLMVGGLLLMQPRAATPRASAPPAASS
jgi:hypothetical protein